MPMIRKHAKKIPYKETMGYFRLGYGESKEFRNAVITEDEDIGYDYVGDDYDGEDD